MLLLNKCILQVTAKLQYANFQVLKSVYCSHRLWKNLSKWLNNCSMGTKPIKNMKNDRRAKLIPSRLPKQCWSFVRSSFCFSSLFSNSNVHVSCVNFPSRRKRETNTGRPMPVTLRLRRRENVVKRIINLWRETWYPPQYTFVQAFVYYNRVPC